MILFSIFFLICIIDFVRIIEICQGLFMVLRGGGLKNNSLFLSDLRDVVFFDKDGNCYLIYCKFIL